eukprot:GHVQ01023054.1.p1 GENE.GHVQ01023054.1~~GHVQ01023054.1.p1  ORF type:complete len:255 (+),score=19.11 GHVQ01023054.1:78-842(+)
MMMTMRLLSPPAFSGSLRNGFSAKNCMAHVLPRSSMRPLPNSFFYSLSHEISSFSTLASSLTQNNSSGAVLRASSKLASLSPMRLSPVNLPPETVGEKAYRWLDIFGFLTRWNNRKAWVMYLDPKTRVGAVMLTEFERKLRMFLNINEVIIFSLGCWIWWYLMNHFNAHPPTPRTTEDGIYAEHKGSHVNPFSRLPGIQPFNRCFDCRWLDFECKRRCFDTLKAEGHTFRVWKDPLTVPREELEPPHHHGHGKH